jgi:cell division protein FtsL
MLQATQAHQVEFQYSYKQHQKQPVRTIKSVYKKTNFHKRILLKTGLALFIYAILVVYLCIKVSTMGYEIVRLEKDIDKLQAANHMLEFKIAEKVSLDRVEMLATKQLGMCKPDISRSIAVAAQKPESVNLASQTIASDIDNSKTRIGEKTLHKLYSNLMILAEKR